MSNWNDFHIHIVDTFIKQKFNGFFFNYIVSEKFLTNFRELNEWKIHTLEERKKIVEKK